VIDVKSARLAPGRFDVLPQPLARFGQSPQRVHGCSPTLEGGAASQDEQGLAGSDSSTEEVATRVAAFRVRSALDSEAEARFGPSV
jgi:hypothetical protein